MTIGYYVVFWYVCGMRVCFTVVGDPVPKARARTVRKGGRTWSFTPKRVAAWEKTVKEICNKAISSECG